VSLWFSSGTTQGPNAGNIGVQSGTIYLWGIQLEIAQAGSTQPTPLEKPDPADDLRRCQRFYCTQNYSYTGLVSATAWGWTVMQTLPVTMRASPTITNNNTTTTNINTPSIVASGVGQVAITGNTHDGWAYQGTFTASADL
jgi:hypothetical protein